MNINSMNDAVTMRPDAGASLGCVDQYDLIHELGGGGFGCVYLAKDTVSGVNVAVKGLPPLVRQNKDELENIRCNFALVSRLHHPNIAAALHLQKVQRAVYNDKSVAEKLRVFEGDTLVVMQYAPGVTLSRWRKQFPGDRVPIDKALDITRQIASALDYAHKENILHRDIKPANIMIETAADGSVKARVLDFGLAAEIRSSMGRVSREVTDTSGTRPYMAPEQWLGGKQGPESDQYSLAVLFYELVSGDVPFASVFETGDPVVMMNVVGREKVEVDTNIPSRMRPAILKALQKKRGERFSSCMEFVAALEGKSKIETKRIPARIIAGVTALVALVFAVVGICMCSSSDDEERSVDPEKEKRLCDEEIYRSLRNPEKFAGGEMEDCYDYWSRNYTNVYPNVMENLKNMPVRSCKMYAHTLAALSCEKSVSYIIDHGILDVNEVGDGGFLHCAAVAGDEDMVKLLVRKGADVSKKDRDRQAPVCWALMGRKPLDMIKLLVGRYGAEIKDVDRGRSLFASVCGGRRISPQDRMSIIKYLIEDARYVLTDEEKKIIFSHSSEDEFTVKLKSYLQSRGIRP